MRRFKQPRILKGFTFVPVLPLKPIALLLASTVLVSYIFHDRSTPQEVQNAWAWASLITSIGMFLLILLIKRFMEGGTGLQVHVTTYMVGAALLGALKGTASAALVANSAKNGVIDWAEFFIRGYSGASMAAGVAFALALHAGYRKNHLELNLLNDEENQQLANDLVELRNEIMLLRTSSEEKIVARILNNIDVHSKIDLFAEDPEKNWRKISAALHKGVTDRLRRQSHELAQISKVEPSIKERVRVALQLKVFHIHPKVHTLIAFSIGAATYYSAFRRQTAFILLPLNTITILLVTTFFRNQFLRKRSISERGNIFIFGGLIISISFIFALNQFLVLGYFNPRLFIIVTIWQVFLLYSISGISEILQQMRGSKLLAESVNDDLQDKTRILKQYLARLNSEIGKHLHGYLLARVNAVASNLEKLAQAGQFDQYRIELEKLLSEFSLESIREGMELHQITDQYFQLLQELWDGLVEVKFSGDLNFHLKLQQVQTVELASVIEELIANSYRHGNATKVRINFEPLANGDLKITAVDDGIGVRSNIVPALGSTIFNLASENRWSLTNSPDSGAVVELLITPYSAESAVRFPTGVPATFDQSAARTP